MKNYKIKMVPVVDSLALAVSMYSTEAEKRAFYAGVNHVLSLNGKKPLTV